MAEQAVVRVVKSRLNLGEGPTVHILSAPESSENPGYLGQWGFKPLTYRKDLYVEKFPLLVCWDRLDDTLEMNLFLIHRYLGMFSLKKNAILDSPALSLAYQARLKGSGVSLKTVDKNAANLSVFLSWILKHEPETSLYDYLSEPLNINVLHNGGFPIWRFRQFLIGRIERREIEYQTASNILATVKVFYEWAWLQRRIKKLPFEYSCKNYRPRRSSNSQNSAENLLFKMGSGPTKLGGVPVITTNLRLPKRLTQAKSSPEQCLQPFSSEEITNLLCSKVISNSVSRYLWVQLGLRCGLREFEITLLNRSDVINPETSNLPYYRVIIIGTKGNKTRQVSIPTAVMTLLWEYTNSEVFLNRKINHEIKFGTSNPSHPLPLFMNQSGERVIPRTISNIISLVRAENKSLGVKVLRRKFHDLRSTFGTNLARFMLDRGFGDGHIRVVVMRELGHSSFKSSQKYINFIKDLSLDEAMKPWVDEIYSHVNTRLDMDQKDE